jgi:methionyl aminopeptidase
MRAAGRLAASVLDMIEPFVQPGVTTDELDKRCHDFIVDELKSIPANLNYRGFPKTICTSVNHVVCHGIPGEQAAQERRYRQYRRHGDPRRLSRRHQPHVFRGHPAGGGAAPLRDLPRGDVARDSDRAAGSDLGDIGMRSRPTPRQQLLGRARVLRPRHRPDLSRRSASAALWQAGHGPRARRGHDLYDRTDDQCRAPRRAGARRRLDRRDRDQSLSAQWEHTILVTDPASKCSL